MSMISIPDSDDDNLKDANENPLLCTEAQKANIKKKWALEESQGKCHAWSEPCIKESIQCVTKGHGGDQCQGTMPSCNLQLVVEADGLHEDVVKQKDLHMEPITLREFEMMHGMDVTEGPKSEAASPLCTCPPLGVQEKEALCSELFGDLEWDEPKELQEASVAEAEANKGQLHNFCDASQSTEFCDETQPDLFSDTQPSLCDETQLDYLDQL